jgi:hypothetical protein
MVAVARSRSEAVRLAAARREKVRRLARTDVNVFCEFVGRDEKTGIPIVQAPIHQSWHRYAEEHERLVLWAHVEGGKSQQITVLRTLFELGRDPSLRFLLLSNTQNQAAKFARSIKTYIEQSKELREVFPDLVPGEPWGEHQFSVRRPTFSKDPSVTVAGIHGSIQGARLDIIAIDDLLDFENTRTADGRKDTIDWMDSALLGRLTATARVRIVGNAFHPQDALHQFAARPGWQAFRFPVLDPNVRCRLTAGHAGPHSVTPPERLTGLPCGFLIPTSRWPERWSLERIEKKRGEMTPIEFARQMLCEARDDSTSIFSRLGIEIALRLGAGTSIATALTDLPRGYRTYTGVDLAVQQKDGADQTCFFTIAVDPMGNRSVLEIDTGRWSGPEIVARIAEKHHRFRSIVVVENNAAQDFIVQFARAGTSVPVKPYTTGRNKAHPEHGIASISVEMQGGKWRIPNEGGNLVGLAARMHPEVRAWVDEMLYYSPTTHTGDRLMASFFAREGIRMGSTHVESHTSVDFNRR